MAGSLMLFLVAGAAASPALAQDTQLAQSQPAPAPPANAAPTPPAAPSLGPSMTGPLHLNSDPLHIDGGPLGPVYVSGVISGIGIVQDHPFPGDHDSRADLSNGMVIVQTVEGQLQFYAQVGGYSLPSIGTPYFTARHLTSDTFGPVPVAYVKLAPDAEFNIQIGKLFTLQGAENLFTFQNFDIERGLLWNQTASINRGVQANYAHGPLSVSVSINDGFYSNTYNWLSGTISYTPSAKDSVTFGAAANLGHTNKSTFATPLVLNNGELYFLSWTHTNGPWTIQPYVQWERASKDISLGILHSASTYGAAIIGKYSFNDQWALAGRAEIIKSTGSLADSAPSLLYGPGSSAWSLTLTPTWQRGILFARVEGSYVHAWHAAPGFGLGPNFSNQSQVRGLIEAGIII